MGKRMSGIVATFAAALLACLLVCVVVPLASAPGSPSSDSKGSDVAGAAAIGERIGPDSSGEDEGNRDAASGDGGNQPVYESGTVLVTLEEGVSADEAIKTLADETGLSGLALDSEGPGFVKIALPEGVEVEDALALMEGSSVVAASQPNFYYYIQEGVEVADGLSATASSTGGLDLTGVQIQDAEDPATNDPELEKQWDIRAIRAPEAWDKLMKDGKISDEPKADGAVCIAVVDEGFNANHEDLKDVIVETYNATKKEGDLDITNVKESHLEYGHGTHVAGIAAAQVNNEKGVAGVSHNAKLMLVKVCDDSGGMTTDTLVTAYDHIMAVSAKHNVRVINISLGGKIPPESQVDADKLFYKSIDKAFEKNIVTVCSAGNSDTAPVPYYNYPSDYPTAVSVINVNKEGKRSSASNYNDPKTGDTNKNISAPGASIYNTHFLSSQSDEKNNSYYGYKSGTSMAAPHVAGVFALMFSADPSLTAGEAKSKLYSTAKDLKYTNGDEVATEGWDPYTGFGMVDAFAAVNSSALCISGKAEVDVGGSIQLTCRSNSSALTWETSDEGVAKVSPDGVVTGIGEGSAVISVSDGIGKAIQQITVIAPKISGPTLLEVGQNVTYQVTSAIGGDWTWLTSNPAVLTIKEEGRATSAGAGRVVLSAVSQNDSNVRASIDVEVGTSLDDAVVVFSKDSFTYTGKSLRPEVSVTDDGIVIDAEDYEIVWPDDTVNVGTKNVAVVGKGGYYGGVKKSYSILKAANPMVAKGLTKTLKYSKLKKKAQTIKTLVFVKDAQGDTVYKKVSGNAKIIVKKDGAVKVKKKLKPGKYKVGINVSAGGTANYEPTSTVVTAYVRVKK